jgi:hypothetical protein
MSAGYVEQEEVDHNKVLPFNAEAVATLAAGLPPGTAAGAPPAAEGQAGAAPPAAGAMPAARRSADVPRGSGRMGEVDQLSALAAGSLQRSFRTHVVDFFSFLGAVQSVISTFGVKGNDLPPIPAWETTMTWQNWLDYRTERRALQHDMEKQVASVFAKVFDNHQKRFQVWTDALPEARVVLLVSLCEDCEFVLRCSPSVSHRIRTRESGINTTERRNSAFTRLIGRSSPWRG